MTEFDVDPSSGSLIPASRGESASPELALEAPALDQKLRELERENQELRESYEAGKDRHSRPLPVT